MTITVVGTVFVDIKGFANGTVHAETKNVGRIETVHGGVGRNVVEAIGRAGGATEFVSAVDVSGEGALVARNLREIGIGTQHVLSVPQGMGNWLAVLDGAGSLVASISQQPDHRPVEQLLMEKGEELVRNSKALVLEFDLKEEVVRQLLTWAKQYNVPAYGIVGNLDVLVKSPELIQSVHMFICNSAEAEVLLGRAITTRPTCQQAAKDLAQGGMQACVITMGCEGSVFYDRQTDTFGHVPVQTVEVADTTGAGDSFFAGTVYGVCEGYTLERSVMCGTQLAAWTISSRHNVDPEIQDKVKRHPLFQQPVTA